MERQQLWNCTSFHYGNVNRVRSICVRQCTPRINIYDLHDRIIPYEKAWQWQKMLVDRTLQLDETEDRGSLGAIVILQHEPVYTLGEGSTVKHVLFDVNDPPFPLFRIERGGEVTYHGPGQLVMYPILNLRHLKTDLHWYLRSLEEIVIQALENVSGIHGSRIDGLTGVWVKDEKVAAIGIRATRWITYHGLALNVTADLAPFANIVPCGIGDKKVTSILKVEARHHQPEDEQYGYKDSVMVDQMLDEYSYGLIDAFGTVFEIDVDSSERCKIFDGDFAIRELESLYSKYIGNNFIDK